MHLTERVRYLTSRSQEKACAIGRRSALARFVVPRLRRWIAQGLGLFRSISNRWPASENVVWLYVPPVDENCSVKCAEYLARWERWFQKTFKAVPRRHNGIPGLLSDGGTAMLVVPESLAEYDAKLMDRKTPSKVRKA